MKEETREWIRLAESDLRVARRESRVIDEPSYSAVCFHAQQAAEKLLKAFLQEHDIPIVKTHDLVYLLELILPLKPLWSVYRKQLEQLTEYAVTSRYPGEEATKDMALEAVQLAGEIHKMLIAEFR